jgi:hypothetical protein
VLACNQCQYRLKTNGLHGVINNHGKDHGDLVGKQKKTLFHKDYIHGIMVYACDQLNFYVLSKWSMKPHA